MAPKKNQSNHTKVPQKKPQKQAVSSGSSFAIIAILALVVSGVYYMLHISNREIIDDTVGLNQVVGNYASGVYSEIDINGTTLLAKRKDVKTIMVSGRPITQTNVDKVMLPPNDGIVALGFNAKNNPTKIVVEDLFWQNTIADV